MQLLASITTTVYVSADKSVNGFVVPAGPQSKVKPPTPPDTSNSIKPSSPPKQETIVNSSRSIMISSGCGMITNVSIAQFPEITCNVCVSPIRKLAVLSVARKSISPDSQVKINDPLPPTGVAVADPFDGGCPKQDTPTKSVNSTVIRSGSSTIKVVDTGSQPLASVTDSVYSPAANCGNTIPLLPTVSVPSKL